MRCIETDLDPAAVESADMDSRGMVLELAMLDSPEFAGPSGYAAVQSAATKTSIGSG
jgi:hypothetical protein